MHNKCLKSVGGLVLDPVFEDEAKDTTRHFQQEEDGEEYCIRSQQCCVLSQSSNTANECDNEGDGSTPYEDKCWVQGNVRQLGQIVECVLLCPGPDSNSQNSKSEEPEDDIESEDDIFKTAGDLTCVANPPPSLVSGMVRIPRRHPVAIAVTLCAGLHFILSLNRSLF